MICGGKGISDAYYCKECTILEKDRDGCPKIVNLGQAKTDMFYESPCNARNREPAGRATRDHRSAHLLPCALAVVLLSYSRTL